MKAIDRLYSYLDFKQIKPTVFERNVGLSSGYLSNMKKRNADLGESVIVKINDYCHDLRIEWLLSGIGEMLSDQLQPKTERKGIPLIPVSAIAGYATGDVQVLEYEIENHYHIPDFEEKGVKFLIRASGSSMYPKYSNGDILACKPITDLSFFRWGKVYVLDTDQGALVKRLYPCPDDDGYLECRSEDKENFPTYKIRKSSIRSVAIVVGVVRVD